jgi:hypothetical protein
MEGYKMAMQQQGWTDPRVREEEKDETEIIDRMREQRWHDDNPTLDDDCDYDNPEDDYDWP